jgi:preprotein translocase subunit SecD
MSNSTKWRGLLVLFCILLAVVSLAPTFIKASLPSWWNKSFSPIHLGLDLQGGVHLVLAVEVDKAVQSRLDSIVNQTEDLLKQQNIMFKKVALVPGDRVQVTVYDQTTAAKVGALMKDNFPNLHAMTAAQKGNFVTKEYGFSDQEVNHIKDFAVKQALETMRNRIDQFGVTEPTIQRQGTYDILIELPGVKDPERAIALLGKTARLEFKMVDENVNPSDALKGNIPPNDEILYERNVDPQTGVVTKTPIVVKRQTVMTGNLVSDAQVRIDNRFNEPYVALDFNSEGARLFDQITGANVGKRMAIVLDNVVYSAPVIRERISGGSAQISGSFTSQEATDLAIILRAGSLPAPVKILENRTVGPSLGRDSIHAGIIAIILAALLVVLAMALYYRGAGVIANVALGVNFLFMLAILSLFQATLTLPGIAGIALTLGMAVDANVLINERVREELRLGKTARAALEAGYEKAFWTVMDSNLTTLLSGLILLQFGTGPVKGFGVTLSIGIVTTLFTALFVTRLIYHLILERRPIKRLSI